MKKKILQFGSRALDFFSPVSAVCLGCGDLTGLDHGPWLCDRCARRLYPGFHALRRDLLPGNGASAVYFALYYEPPVSNLVRQLKFSGVKAIVPFLADCMMPAVEALDLSGYDGFMAVPLHRNRLRERGYNQAEELARALSERTGLPVLHGLKRGRETHRQSELRLEDRGVNVRGAFTCDASVKGLRVLLIDDVYTTGATIHSCAGAAVAAGAREVHALTLAGSRHFRTTRGLVLRRI
ncbi:MAG: ComF family protein [Clostridia bacterium]|nr:ComF family protein [Clostridia bacterium]